MESEKEKKGGGGGGEREREREREGMGKEGGRETRVDVHLVRSVVENQIPNNNLHERKKGGEGVGGVEGRGEGRGAKRVKYTPGCFFLCVWGGGRKLSGVTVFGWRLRMCVCVGGGGVTFVCCMHALWCFFVAVVVAGHAFMRGERGGGGGGNCGKIKIK